MAAGCYTITNVNEELIGSKLKKRTLELKICSSQKHNVVQKKIEFLEMLETQTENVKDKMMITQYQVPTPLSNLIT